MLATLQPPEPPREFRAIWVASVDHIDFPSRAGLTQAEQQSQLAAIVDSCAKAKLNAILFQVRPAADALYESSLEPWSEYLTGRQGKAPEPIWDPLRELIRIAHDRGIEVHAWINPFRANHASAKSSIANNHVIAKFPDDVFSYGRNIWMDPASGELRRHSLNVIRDLIRRYDIDGVHIDDYFYPYPVKDAKIADDATFATYKKSGGALSRSDWRRQNVDAFVRDLHTLLKFEKPWLMFGISPFGIYRPGVPKGIEAGIDQFAQLYSDPVKWAREGWCDYLSPQLYWTIDSKGQPFKPLLDYWRAVCGSRVDCWPGLYTSRLGKDYGNWPLSEITNQISLTRKNHPRIGHVHFSQRAFRNDYKSIASKANSMYSTIALPPVRRGAKGKAPAMPEVSLTANRSTNVIASADGANRFVLQTFANGKWMLASVNKSGSFVIEKAERIAVAAMDVWGRLSDWTIKQVSAAN